MRQKLKGKHGNKHYGNIFLCTRQHLTPRLPLYREGNEEEERSGTTDQQARDQDAEKEKRGAETANRRAAESDVTETKQAVYNI